MVASIDLTAQRFGRLTLDRENNDGNYEPGNCHWATYAQQVANRRRGVLCPAT